MGVLKYWAISLVSVLLLSGIVGLSFAALGDSDEVKIFRCRAVQYFDYHCTGHCSS